MTHNCFILSYQGNEKMAERLKKQLIYYNFPNVEIVYAPNMALQNYKRSAVVFHTFKNYLLPRMIESDNDCIVFEDDADIQSDYEEYARCADRMPMMRLAWWKMNRVKGIPSFLVGSTIVSYKKSFINKFAETMKKSREQHIDGFLTKKFVWREDWDYLDNYGLGGTVSHKSYIMNDEFRKGQVGSDASKDYQIPVIEAGY